MGAFTIIEGTPGLTLDDVAHLMIPGRGRDYSGTGLTAASWARVIHAHELYTEIDLNTREGRIVCSGYKSPSDESGEPWTCADASGAVFCGVPEADSMRTALIERGVPEAAIRAERRSIDTVTNFVMSEAGKYFGDARPVAIVAQQQHLHRILDIVARRTLRREYLGVLVPENPTPDSESCLARLVSRYVLRGMTADNPRLEDVTVARVNCVWRIVRRLPV